MKGRPSHIAVTHPRSISRDDWEAWCLRCAEGDLHPRWSGPDATLMSYEHDVDPDTEYTVNVLGKTFPWTAVIVGAVSPNHRRLSVIPVYTLPVLYEPMGQGGMRGRSCVELDYRAPQPLDRADFLPVVLRVSMTVERVRFPVDSEYPWAQATTMDGASASYVCEHAVAFDPGTRIVVTDGCPQAAMVAVEMMEER